MSSSQTPPPPSPWQEVVLVLLRMGIGWHFLYEGLVKALSPGWTSAAFLAESRWLLSGSFHWIVAHPVVLRIVDLLNVWGLVLIGLALLLGAFSRFAAISGIALLSLYYVASPPLVGLASNGARGQLPDRQQEPGRDPRPLRGGRVPRGRVLRPRALSRRPVVARAPARGRARSRSACPRPPARGAS